MMYVGPEIHTFFDEEFGTSNLSTLNKQITLCV